MTSESLLWAGLNNNAEGDRERNRIKSAHFPLGEPGVFVLV